VSSELESRPETWAKLSQHFFETFPQLEGVKFSHMWGGVIDTSSRFCVFWGRRWAAASPTRSATPVSGVAASRFGAAVMLDLLDGRRTRSRHADRVRAVRPLPFPPEPFRSSASRPPAGPRPRGQDRQAQPLAPKGPRQDGPRLRLLTVSPDWATALARLGVTRLDERSVATTLGAVLKYREDHQRVQQHGIADIVKQAFDRGPPADG
jgi:hypothetical protein